MDIVVSFEFLPTIGGAHLWMYEQYRRWPTGVRVVTARRSSDPAEAERERAFDAHDHGAIEICRVAPLREMNLIDPRYWLTCLSQARSIATSSSGVVTHLHSVRAFPEGAAALLCRRLYARQAKLITYAHGEEILVARTSRQFASVARVVYGASDLVIANSEGTRQMVAELCPSARIVRVSPGVDVAAYQHSDEDVQRYRQQRGWGAGTVAIVTVARMEPRKNHAMVLEAVAALRRKGLPLVYFCGGDGEERAALVQKCSALEIEPWVHFAGAVHDQEKRLAFAAAQIHAMPSIQVGPMIEGFGIVFIEAAAAGLPSIAGNTGGQTEAVLDGETGLIVDGTNLAEVSGAIEKLACDPALRARLGAKGRGWAAKNDWSCVARAAHEAIARLNAPLSS
jgi:phosphatidylinositol alpha-1,6-mannosyltransferase